MKSCRTSSPGLIEVALLDRMIDPGTDPVLAALERRHERLVRLRETIADRSSASFVLVTIRRFSAMMQVRVRQLPRDVYGIASLGLISEQLLGSS